MSHYKSCNPRWKCKLPGSGVCGDIVARAVRCTCISNRKHHHMFYCPQLPNDSKSKWIQGNEWRVYHEGSPVGLTSGFSWRYHHSVGILHVCPACGRSASAEGCKNQFHPKLSHSQSQRETEPQHLPENPIQPPFPNTDEPDPPAESQSTGICA